MGGARDLGATNRSLIFDRDRNYLRLLSALPDGHLPLQEGDGEDLPPSPSLPVKSASPPSPLNAKSFVEKACQTLTGAELDDLLAGNDNPRDSLRGQLHKLILQERLVKPEPLGLRTLSTALGFLAKMTDSDLRDLAKPGQSTATAALLCVSIGLDAAGSQVDFFDQAVRERCRVQNGQKRIDFVAAKATLVNSVFGDSGFEDYVK